MKRQTTALLLALALVLTVIAPTAAAGEGSASEMAGLLRVHSAGLDGTGTVIAVIDSGLDIDHPAFAADGMDEGAVKLQKEDITSRFGSLNASKYGTQVRAEDVYVSAKIPFAFDYTRGSSDVSHSKDGAGDHGTGVACAAAGIETEMCAAGAAPGAQLLIMKVFPDHSNAASDAALEYAIEDAIRLGADVINLSLGEVNGFAGGDEAYIRQLQRAADAGIVVCAAAGNERSSAYQNNSGVDLSTTGNVDIGLLSRPGTVDTVLSVASVNSAMFYANGISYVDRDGERAFATFNDTGPDFGLREFISLLGQAGHEDGVYPYAVVPGIGTEEDFARVDVRGRIALIRRGEITFVEKSDNAFAHGALGVIVYNNVSEQISMDLTGISEKNDLPCVIITKEAGEDMVSAAGEDGVGTLTVLTGQDLVETPEGGEPSYFSSWGPMSDLTMKPDLAGVGGYVWTAVNNGGYGTTGGTSLASPQAAGTAAVLLQYVREEYGLTGAAARERVQTLLMNTARPLLQENGAEHSPRKQGAGFVDAESAVSTPIRVTVDGSDLPKAELGDDKDGTGVYTFTITVHNDSDEDALYFLRTSMNTETAEDGYMLQQARSLACETTYTGEDVDVLCRYDGDGQMVYYDVTGDGRVTLMDAFLLGRAVNMGGGGTVTVPAGGETQVTVTVSLADQERKTLAETFENGIYVEGYVYLEAMGGLLPTVSVPVLAFYGDWGKAPLFEQTARAQLDAASSEGEALGNSVTGFALLTGSSGYVGENPVGQDEVYIPERSNALNTSGRKGGAITGVELDLLRNARSVKVEIVSQGRALLERSEEELVKSYSDGSGDGVQPVYFSGIYFDPARYGLHDGSTFTVRITGEKDADGPYAVETMEVPVYVDGTAPVFRDVSLNTTADGRTFLTVRVQDNFYTAGIFICTADMRTEVAAWTFDQRTKGETVTLEVDVTDLDLEGGRFILCAEDYARNTSTYFLF